MNSAWPSSDGVQTYGAANDLWGTTWNYIQVNQTNFGVAFSWDRTGGGGGNSLASIDLITITVNYTLSPVPIKLLSFNAEALAQQVKLSWITATEINNDYFTIEKTNDGINFEIVDTIDGAGNSIFDLSYSTYDESPYKGVSYYRLKQTDFNGDFSYSELRSVNFDADKLVMDAYPNPSDGKNISVTLFSFDGTTDILNVLVYDGLSRLVYSQHSLVNPLAVKQSVLVSLPENTKDGMYYIAVGYKNKIYHKTHLIKAFSRL